MTKTTKKKINKETIEVVKKDIKLKNEDVCCGDSCCEPKSIKIKVVVALIILAILAGLYVKFGVVATVNGKSISRAAYISKLEKADNKSVLDQMIQESIIEGEAKKNNIVVDKKEVDDEMTKIEEQIKASGMTLEDAMKAEGVTREEVEEQIRKQKIVEKLANPNTEVKEEEIKDFLEKNKAFLPKDKTKEELDELAKQQLVMQKKSEAIESWLERVKTEAKISYR